MYSIEWPDAEHEEREVERLAVEFRQARDDHDEAQKALDAIDAPYDERIQALEAELRQVRLKKHDARREQDARVDRLRDQKDSLKSRGEAAAKRLIMAQAKGVVPTDWEEAKDTIEAIGQHLWKAAGARAPWNHYPEWSRYGPIKRPLKVAGYAVYGVTMAWEKQKFYVGWDRRKKEPVGFLFIASNGEAVCNVGGEDVDLKVRYSQGWDEPAAKPLEQFTDALTEHRFQAKVA